MKRVLSGIIVVCMIIMMLPTMILAEEKAISDEAAHYYELYQSYMPALISMCEDIDKRIYTQESVDIFNKALKNANDIISNEVKTEEDLKQCEGSFDALYKAYYSKLMPEDGFEVDFSFNDNYAARGAGNFSSGYIERISCEPGETLANIFDRFKQHTNVNANLDESFVIINGVYVNFQYLDDETEYFRFHNPEKIILHPDDDIVVYTSAPETTLGGALGASQAYLKQYIESLRLQELTTDGDEVEAAEYLTVAVSESNPVLGADHSALKPASGLTIFVSEPQPEKGGYVKTSPLSIDSKTVTTDDNGQVSFKLYGEGWVFVQAINLKEDKKGNYNYYVDNAPITPGTYYSVGSGAGKWMHITASTKSDAVKADLTEELTAYFEMFDQQIFPTDLLETFLEAYETGKQGITDSENIASGRKVQQTAITTMRAVYDNAVSENENRLNNFRNALAKLPEDVSLITQGEQSKVDAVKTAYGRFTPYLISRLSEQETEKYQKIASLTDLPEAKEYEVKVNVVADNDEATETLNKMIEWLNSDEGRYYDANNQGIYGEGARVDKIYIPNKSNSFNDKDYLTSGKRAPAEGVYIVTNFNTSAWFPVLYRDYGKTYVGNQGDEYTKVEGDGWTIYDTKEGGVSVVQVGGYRTATPVGNLKVLLNGVAYEPKDITFEGVDEVTFPDYYAYREPSAYKGTDKFNLKFQDAYAYFQMPYNDVTITVTWGKANTSTATSVAADELTKVYNSCVKANYSDANWTELSAIYEKGINAIRKAAEPDVARSEYVEKLMAVPTKRAPSEWGSVHVTISNHTFAEGPWYDAEEPFISETIDLEEDDSMMTAILKALEENGFAWNGTGGQAMPNSYDITYLSSVSCGDEELAEFTGGSGSGWMGTLNDWFTNQGFAAFTVENGMLKDGDRIDVVYTCDLGNDVACGMEGITDTSLLDLQLSNGTLMPEFSGKKKAYTFLLDAGKHSTELNFEAKWKVFLCKAYKGSYQPESTDCYQNGDSIYLEDGDTIYIGCGDPAWPSMADQNIAASIYKINVVATEEPEPIELHESDISFNQTQFIYTGKEIKPSVTVKDGEKILEEEKDYSLTYSNNINVGTAKVTVDFMGDYVGTITKEFSIQPKSLDSDSVTLKTSTYTFDGEMKTPEVVVKDGDKALEAGKDYKVSYSNNVNAGTAKATVTLNGNYSGKLEKTYTIAAKQLGSDAVELKTNRCTYTGKAIKPAVTVKDVDKVLSAGTDYSVSYSNNTKVGTGKVSITLKGNYSGKITKSFTIKKAQKITVKVAKKTYKASALKKKAASFSIGTKRLGTGKITYSCKSKSIKISSKGKVTVAKKTKKGTYTLTIKVAEDKTYYGDSKKVKVVVK